MSKKALGIIEAKGLAIGVVAADAAVKSANVTLIGYELSGGTGYTTIKLEGDVGAVTAAVQSGVAAANQGIGIVGYRVIPRPAEGLEMFIRNEDTVGYAQERPDTAVPAPRTDVDEEPAAPATPETGPAETETPVNETEFSPQPAGLSAGEPETSPVTPVKAPVKKKTGGKKPNSGR